MADKELVITLKPETEGALTGFPFDDDQYISNEEGSTVSVYLAHRQDTTVAQEQHLNVNPNVLSYKVQDES